MGQICETHVEACRSLIHRPEGKNWVLPLDIIMPSLPHLHVAEGYVFEAIYTDNDFSCMADISIPYIRPRGSRSLNEFQWERWSKNIPDGYYSPLEKMVGDCSPEAAWEAVLLEDMERRLPMFQHACYCLIDYITDLDEYPRIAHITECGEQFTGLSLEVTEDLVENTFKDQCRKPLFRYETSEQIRAALKYLNDPSLLPSATQIGERSFSMGYCYWNEWSGLHRVRKNVSFGQDSISVKEVSDKNLVQFHCGIWF